MDAQHIPDFRNARIMDVARHGSTISGIAHQTGIPFPSVRRAVYAFENIGIVKTTKIGKKVFVRANPNHPVVNSMIGITRWVNSVIWDPDTFVAQIFERHHIDYAFVGTSKIKYTRNESRNMVQIAVSNKHFTKAKKIINDVFKEIGIRTTEDSRKTIGSAMSTVYIKCLPVDRIRYEEYTMKSESGDAIKIRVADNETERRTMRHISVEDKMFIPSQIYR